MDPSDSRCGLLRFRFLIRISRWSPHHRIGSPALGSVSSITCRPCYPGRKPAPLPLFQRASGGLPLLTTGSASPIRLRGYSWVHLRYGLLFCYLETHDPELLRRRFLTLPRRTDNSLDGTSTRWTHCCYCERSGLYFIGRSRSESIFHPADSRRNGRALQRTRRPWD